MLVQPSEVVFPARNGGVEWRAADEPVFGNADDRSTNDGELERRTQARSTKTCQRRFYLEAHRGPVPASATAAELRDRCYVGAFGMRACQNSKRTIE